MHVEKHTHKVDPKTDKHVSTDTARTASHLAYARMPSLAKRNATETQEESHMFFIESPSIDLAGGTAVAADR